MMIIPAVNDYSIKESFIIDCYYGTYYPYLAPNTDIRLKYKDLDSLSGQKNRIVVSTDGDGIIQYSTDVHWNESNYNLYRSSIKKESSILSLFCR